MAELWSGSGCNACPGGHTEGREREARGGDSGERVGVHAADHRAGQPLPHRTGSQVRSPQHRGPGEQQI